MSVLESRIRKRFDEFGAAASPSQFAQLLAYIGLLTKWNSSVNLTAFSLEPPSDDAIDRLLVEPLLAAAFVRAQFETNPRELLLDLGSGGGSPAIPLKIALPHLKLMMVESRGKKAAFLREAVRQVGLPDTEVLNVRIEALAGLSAQLTSDLISIRAVRADFELWETSASLLREGGRVLWFRTDSTHPSDAGQDAAGIPAGFALETIRPLVPVNHSELAVLRKAR